MTKSRSNNLTKLKKNGKTHSRSTRKMKGGVNKSAFIKFAEKNREQIKKDLAKSKGIKVEDIKFGDTAKEISRLWFKNMTPAEKAAYYSPTSSPISSPKPSPRKYTGTMTRSRSSRK